MGMVLSFFKNLSKRSPDGSMLKMELEKGIRGSLMDSLTSKESGVQGKYTETGLNKPSTQAASSERRPSRRHPTYSAKMKVGESEESLFEDDYEEDSEEEEEIVSSQDLKTKKILEYRKLLTKVVKLKTAIFQEKVKVTCTKDGESIEWFKGKEKQEGGQKKASGQFPVAKIVSLKAKSDNPKTLDVATNLPPLTNFYFTFKTREDREIWQSHLESFRKFISIK